MRGNEFRTLSARSAKSGRFSSRISNDANLSCVLGCVVICESRAFAEKVGSELDSRRHRRRRHATVSPKLAEISFKRHPSRRGGGGYVTENRFVLFFGEGPPHQSMA